VGRRTILEGTKEVSCMCTCRTTFRILVLRMNRTGPDLRIRVLVCNMDTIGAILMLSSIDSGRTLQRIPLVVVVLGVNLFHLQTLRLPCWLPHDVCVAPL
jgi:hypothetical protein